MERMTQRDDTGRSSTRQVMADQKSLIHALRGGCTNPLSNSANPLPNPTNLAIPSCRIFDIFLDIRDPTLKVDDLLLCRVWGRCWSWCRCGCWSCRRSRIWRGCRSWCWRRNWCDRAWRRSNGKAFCVFRRNERVVNDVGKRNGNVIRVADRLPALVIKFVERRLVTGETGDHDRCESK